MQRPSKSSFGLERDSLNVLCAAVQAIATAEVIMVIGVETACSRYGFVLIFQLLPQPFELSVWLQQLLSCSKYSSFSILMRRRLNISKNRYHYVLTQLTLKTLSLVSIRLNLDWEMCPDEQSISAQSE